MGTPRFLQLTGLLIRLHVGTEEDRKLSQQPLSHTHRHWIDF